LRRGENARSDEENAKALHFVAKCSADETTGFLAGKPCENSGFEAISVAWAVQRSGDRMAGINRFTLLAGLIPFLRLR
jgi:hypothetical protein